MITLFEHPMSPYAQKCKIALTEKGIPFTAQTPNPVGSREQLHAFLAISPRGEIPVLVDGDVAIFDSTIILEYIEDKWPTPPLAPASPAERARARMIEDAMDTHYEAINWGLGEIRYFKRAEGPAANALEMRAAAQLRGFHNWLERHLGDSPWFNGPNFGWGDLCVVPYINGSADFGFAPDPASKLAQWAARANARPSVASAAQASRASIPSMLAMAGAVAAGMFKREYRDHRLDWMMRSGGIDIVLNGVKNHTIRFSNEFS
jgi:glutathione S-transferase/RNA polymerase-associated protein